MNSSLSRICMVALALGLASCGEVGSENGRHADDSHGHAAETDPPKGPHGGRLLVDGDFTVELAIFESGTSPEFRVWATDAGAPLAPDDVSVHVTLTRLGGSKEEIDFSPQEDFLRGNAIVREPHSFTVAIEAQHGGTTHRWQYDSFEGRTRIGADMAEAFALETELAGPATIRETITVYGRIAPNAELVRSVSARFDGVIQSVNISVGDTVQRGQSLATIESNESLKPYPITAPIGGVVTERAANPGEQTAGRRLFTIMDTTTVWTKLAVFPSDLPSVRIGARVFVRSADADVTREGVVDRLDTVAQANQSVLARVVLDNTGGALVPGMYVTGEILVEEHEVPLAVRRTGLQTFREFDVVYAQIGDEYEVHMLEVGRRDAEWIEVLGGLEPGTRYVTTNSYLVKADIEKSGVTHDH